MISKKQGARGGGHGGGDWGVCVISQNQGAKGGGRGGGDWSGGRGTKGGGDWGASSSRANKAKGKPKTTRLSSIVDPLYHIKRPMENTPFSIAKNTLQSAFKNGLFSMGFLLGFHGSTIEETRVSQSKGEGRRRCRR